MLDVSTSIRGLRQKKLVRHLSVVSRIGRTEYQLLLTKASDRGRNVKFFKVIILVVFDELTNKSNVMTASS